MSEKLYPYVIFLPAERKKNILRAVFRSKVPIDILQYFISKGISQKIYQKNLIDTLSYSNKTVIERLKDLTNLEILREGMEKVDSDGRTVWVKHYVLTDLGKWFALLLAQEDALSREEKIEILQSVLRSYVKWLKGLSEKLAVKKEVLEEIFKDEMK
jgi:hypothetical protein